jgi:hypothetical protein
MKFSSVPYIRDQYIEDGLVRGVEIWFEDGLYHVQDVLCRGIIGAGETEEKAKQNLLKKLANVE